MTVAEVYVETQRSGFREGPSGYFSLPADLVETDFGLYEIPVYLVEDSVVDGIYLVPVIDQVDYFSGIRSNISSYSVQEDATPINPGSLEGGAGQITLEFDAGDDTLFLMQEVVTLEDTYGQRGQTQGTVRSVSDTDSVASLSIDGILTLLNSDHIVMPRQGRLDAALQYYCNVVGVPNTLVVDPSIASRQVVYPGWNGNVWERIKQICAAEKIEMALVYNDILVRPLRTINAVIDRDITRQVNIDASSTARKVEMAYFNNTWQNFGEVYPLLDQEPSIYTVDAGETLRVEVRLNASLTGVNQPQCVAFVENRPYPNTNGVYSVAGNDGKPVTPAQWNAQGGFVKVHLTDDPSIIEIEIRGADMADYAPYRIAMTSGASNYYNSLHITGTGVLYERKSVLLSTGASAAVTGEDVGMVVENPFVRTKEQAFDVGVQASKGMAGTYTINGTTTSILPTNPGTQAFGNVAGARVRRGDAMFRVKTASSSPSDIQYTADQDTLISDFDAAWPEGMTIAEFNAQWSGRLIKDFNTAPLRRDA